MAKSEGKYFRFTPEGVKRLALLQEYYEKNILPTASEGTILESLIRDECKRRKLSIDGTRG